MLSKRETTVKRDQPNPAEMQGEKLTGYAILFNQKSNLIRENGQQFYEIIDPGAFTESIAKNNISFVFRHNDDSEYGDTQSKTLILTEDEKGVHFTLALPQYAKTLRNKLESGIIGGMSFEFVPTKIEVDANQVRHIVKGDLYHISAVYSPAYDTGVPTLQRQNTSHYLTNKKLLLKLLEMH